MEWVEKKSSELYVSSSGLSKSSDQFGYGYPFLSYKDVFNNYYAPDKLSTLVNSTEKDRMKCSVKQGDVFLTRTSETTDELGMSCVALHDYVNATFNGFTKRLRPLTDEIEPKYAAYYFRSPYFRSQCISLASLITRASLNDGMIRRLKIRYPLNRKVQEKIGEILYTYDTLIENNNKRIRLLEKMAENLYKEWFVRFRFPGHENVEMENGLPKGWKVKKYEDEFNVKYGKELPTDKLTKDGFPVFGSTGQIGYYTSYMYETPQILISCRGASSGVVNISLPKSFITNNSLICEMTNETESVFEYLKYCFLNTNLVQYQTGSAQPQITINNIVKLKLLIPSTDVQIKFADKVRTLDKEVGNLQHQNSLLARQRDLLLPRLMSGKLEVKVKE